MVSPSRISSKLKLEGIHADIPLNVYMYQEIRSDLEKYIASTRIMGNKNMSQTSGRSRPQKTAGKSLDTGQGFNP